MRCRGQPARLGLRRAAAAAAFFGAAAALGGAGREKVVSVSAEVRVSIAGADEITLLARPLPGEGIDAFVKRLTDDPKSKKAILSANGRTPALEARPVRARAVSAARGQLPHDRDRGALPGGPRDRGRVGAPRHGAVGQAREPLAHRRVVHGRRAALSGHPRGRCDPFARNAGGAGRRRAPEAADAGVPRGRRGGRPSGRGGGAEARLRAGREGPLCHLPAAQGRGALLRGGRALHRASPRGGRQREGRGDRGVQRHHRRPLHARRLSRSGSRSRTSRRSSARRTIPSGSRRRTRGWKPPSSPTRSGARTSRV